MSFFLYAWETRCNGQWHKLEGRVVGCEGLHTTEFILSLKMGGGEISVKKGGKGGGEGEELE